MVLIKKEFISIKRVTSEIINTYDDLKTSQIYKMDSFATIINKVVKYWANLSILDVLLGPGYSYSISMLKMNERQKNQPKNQPWICFTFILISCSTFLSLYNFEWLEKWKWTNLLFHWKRKCLPGFETFKTRM